MLFNLWGGTINFLFEKTIRIVDTDCEVQMTIKNHPLPQRGLQ